MVWSNIQSRGSVSPADQSQLSFRCSIHLGMRKTTLGFGTDWCQTAVAMATKPFHGLIIIEKMSTWFIDCFHYIHSFMRMHAHIHEYTFLCIHSHTGMRMYIHTQACMHAQTYIHTYMPTHTYIHVYAYIQHRNRDTSDKDAGISNNAIEISLFKIRKSPFILQISVFKIELSLFTLLV